MQAMAGERDGQLDEISDQLEEVTDYLSQIASHLESIRFMIKAFWIVGLIYAGLVTLIWVNTTS